MKTVTGTPELGYAMHQWHSSASDPIYVVGSMFAAGKPAERAEVEKAISSLRDNWTESGERNADAQNLADGLAKLIAD